MTEVPKIFECRACEKQSYFPPGSPAAEEVTFSVPCSHCGAWQWTRDTVDGVDPRSRR